MSRFANKKGMPLRASLELASIGGSALVGGREHVHAATFAVELHFAIDQREQRVVLAAADALAGVDLGAELADQDVAGRRPAGRRSA